MIQTPLTLTPTLSTSYSMYMIAMRMKKMKSFKLLGVYLDEQPYTE
jgi:hypothetical protein